MKRKEPKSILAWAILDGNNPMYIGGCDPDGKINHLEIFKYYREAKQATEGVESPQTIVKCRITFTHLKEARIITT